ncbi:MAG: aminopeptidase family protein P, partial [Catenibacillus sp.]|nr:aminopeptidase family protein P [Catenibacillus sp.]
VIPAKWGMDLETCLEKKGAKLCGTKNLIDEIWTDRPAMPKDKLFILEEKYAGETMAQKVLRVREKMAEAGVGVHILTSLDDIAWLYNLRGSDIANTPVFMAYTMISSESVLLFIDSDKLTAETRNYLKENHVEVMPYNAIYEWLTWVDKDETVLLDLNKVNYAIVKGLLAKIENQPNPTTLFKAVKNDTEIKNLFTAHIKDGVAVTKFMYWLKTNIGKTEITEISASDYLENCRRAQGCIDLSFPTISAYNANAAMMHYSATPESNAVLKPEGLLLVDSGGQYYEGTTDITRTMALGSVSDEWKTHYTAVLRGMLNLQNARFLYGCTGLNLDILARGPMWDMDIDYQCGTGHGVGYLLSVHEGPNGFRWRVVPERNDSAVLEAGMITTDEPGVYIAGSHGIRIENELVCRKGEANEYGQFMYFEPLTFAPIDLDAIDVNQLTAVDKKRLNAYHKLVFDTVSPYLTEEEAAWLKKYTAEV